MIGRQKTAVQKWRVERPEDRNTEVVEKREEKTVVRVLGKDRGRCKGRLLVIASESTSQTYSC